MILENNLVSNMEDEIKENIEYYKGLQNFSTTEIGKKIIDKKKREFISVLNKITNIEKVYELFEYQQMAIQLKYAMKDLVDFSGASIQLEREEKVLETVIEKKA